MILHEFEAHDGTNLWKSNQEVESYFNEYLKQEVDSIYWLDWKTKVLKKEQNGDLIVYHMIVEGELKSEE